MFRKAAIALLVCVVLAGASAYFWAQAILGSDAVRTAIAAQLSTALGQPVTIEGIGAGIYPRVTVRLRGVRIGDPVRADIGVLNVGTDLGALLSRRIEHATLLVEQARIELPIALPDLSAPAESTSGAPVQLASVDEIVLRDVQIVSGGRTLVGHVEIGPRENGLDVRRLSLSAEGMALDAHGVLDDLSRPSGELTVTAGRIDLNQLLAFVADFQRDAGLAAGPAAADLAAAAPGARPDGMDIVVSMEADRATLGQLALMQLSGRARITPGEVTLDPIAFGVFDGRYEGALGLTLEDEPAFRLTAAISGVDMTAATAFAGSPDVITGRLSGRLDLTGRGTDAASVANSARGTVRVDAVDGIVRRLGLVRAIVLATAMRANSAAPALSGSSDEPFRTLGGTLRVENGIARTGDLRLDAENVSVTAQGVIGLDGDPITLTGRVQLSEALTKQAGTDLARYTQEQGRVTLPVSISGSATDLAVRIDVGDMMQRAIRNRAQEETKRAIERIFR